MPANTQSGTGTRHQVTTLLSNLANRLGALTTGLISVTWTVLIFRMNPAPLADYGMFVTVAERLRAGDRLYADVYENKDPFLHYMLAIGRSATPLGGWLLEVLWIVAASISVFVISRQLQTSFRVAAAVGYVATPIVLTGYAYWPGSSHIPGISLVLAVAALALKERLGWASLLSVVVIFFKLVMFPLAAFCVLLALFSKSVAREWAKAAIAALGAFLLSIGLLASRQELYPYWQTLQDNVVYSSSTTDLSLVPALISRIERVFDWHVLLISATTVVLLILAALLPPGIMSQVRDRNGSYVFRASLGCLAISAGTLSFTGLWIHHAQIMLPSALFALALFASRGPKGIRDSSAWAILTPVLLAIPLTGLPNPYQFIQPIEYTRAVIGDHYRQSTEAVAIISSGPPTTFARLGGGDDGGFARGLGEWHLQCRLFGQSTLTPPDLLDELLECLPSAQLVLVAPDFPRTGSGGDWREFVNQAWRILDSDFTCVSSEDGIELCRR